MRHVFIAGLLSVLVPIGMTADSTHAQTPSRGRDLDGEREEALRDFAARVHRIALQYEQAGDREKAKGTLRLLLQTVPNDAEAKAMLDRISKQELTENKTIVKVLANQSWQNTGVQLIAGKPVAIEAKGTWVFRMNRVVSADGLEVPDDMRDFPLGSLVAVIDPLAESATSASRREAKTASQSLDDLLGLPSIDLGSQKDRWNNKRTNSTEGVRPFVIGSKKVFTPTATGTLFLKIHDTNEADNSGELVVTISGQVRLSPGSGAPVAKGRK